MKQRVSIWAALALLIISTFPVHTALARSQDLAEEFVHFFFPLSGREQRTMFLPLPYWGEKKPQYELFKWQEFESDHFKYYSYEKAEETLARVVRYMEEDYERNNRMFGVQHRFTKKVPILFYQTRRDFEQTHVVGGPVPETLGGVTEIFSWNRVTFPFEGEEQKLEHVAKHEGTHVYHVAKGTRKLPLWFIEGSAETNSIYWDADAEMVIRDAYVNGFFYPLKDLWQIQGTWLMYKIGNFITNLLWEEYGEEGFRKIFDRAGPENFETNLKKSLGLTPERLEQKIQVALSERYGDLLKRRDLLEYAQELSTKALLLHARGPFFLSGGLAGPRNALYVNHVALNGKVTRKRIISDRRFKSESLQHFGKGASMDEERIVYSIKRSVRDELRVLPYEFDRAKRKFRLGKALAFSWPEIESISDPVLVGTSRVVFIGHRNGYTDLYLFDWETEKVEALTKEKRFISGLDYSAARNEIVFSREGARAKDRLRYDRNLFVMNLETKKQTRLTTTPKLREIEPRYSPNGKEVLYVADPEGTYDLFVYDFDQDKSRRLTRMRVGARNPQWGSSNEILFNSFTRLVPSIHRHARPTATDLLAVRWPKGSGQTYQLRNGELLAPLVKAPTKNVSTSETDGVYFGKQRPMVRWKGEPFRVAQFAALQDEFVFRGVKGDPEEKRANGDERLRYWTWKDNKLQSLDSTMVDQEGIDDSDTKDLLSLLEGRAIIRAWASKDNETVLALVNNRLAKKIKTFRKRPNVSLVLYNKREKRLAELPDGPVRNLEDPVQWVTFLPSGKILLAIGQMAKGPFSLQIYDQTTKSFSEISTAAERFRVSVDRKNVAWLAGGSFWLFDGQERRRVSDITFAGVMAFDFLPDGNLSVISSSGKRSLIYNVSPNGSIQSTVPIPISDAWSVTMIAIDRKTGDLALRVRPKKKPRIPEKILSWSRANATLTIVAEGGLHYPRLSFRSGYLSYSEIVAGSKRIQSWVWQNGQKTRFELPNEGRMLGDGAIVLRGDHSLVLGEPKKGIRTLAHESAGYAVSGTRIFYSEPKAGRFQLFSYDRDAAEQKQLTSSERDAVEPVIADQMLLWSSGSDDGWKIRQARLANLSKQKEIVREGLDLIHPKVSGGEVTVEAVKKEAGVGRQPQSFGTSYETQTLNGSRAPNPFRLQSLMAGAAFDGRDFRVLLSGFADNLFSDRGFYVDAVFLGGSQFGTAGYADLRHGMAYSGFYNFRDNIRNYGTRVSKTFNLDRYREVNVYGDFEIQKYGLATPETFQFVTPDVENRTFYLLKSGVAYGHDVTIWDRHGPVSGNRFFLKGGAGFDAGNGELGSLDANLDFRLYHQILPRFGFAHRIVAGTSQGNLPNVFLLGGNMSFRGVGFDDLQGQNYWAFSEDLRLPVFDFLGAKFFDPVDQILGFFTRYFDVRGGIYADVGQVWFNSNDPDLVYSVGYFVNVPTMLGVHFRFNQGFAGRKAIGFWFGANW